jgi:deoxyhypusine synthase
MGKIKMLKGFKSRYPHEFEAGKDKYLRGKRILPKPITGKESLPELIENTMLAYNGARLKECCHLFAKKMLGAKVTVGMSLAGAMTPAGIGSSAIIPLIKAGFVDWIVSTGANLYHDLHHALNMPLYCGSPFTHDRELRKVGVVRIYDILIDNNEVLTATDHVLKNIAPNLKSRRDAKTVHCWRRPTGPVSPASVLRRVIRR